MGRSESASGVSDSGYRFVLSQTAELYLPWARPAPSLASCSSRGHWVSPLPQPEDGSTVTPAALPSPATLFPGSVERTRCVVSVLAPQSKRRRKSLSGKAASPEPSALCWAMRPTGHGPTLSGTSAVSRTYAMLPPHSRPPTFPS